MGKEEEASVPVGGEKGHRGRSEQPARRVRFEREAPDVNECADDFIRQFRRQLELERLKSIENYQQMLERSL